MSEQRNIDAVSGVVDIESAVQEAINEDWGCAANFIESLEEKGVRLSASNEAKIDALTKALAEAIDRLEDVEYEMGYQFDGDFTEPQNKLLPRLRAALSSHTEQEGGGRG